MNCFISLLKFVSCACSDVLTMIDFIAFKSKNSTQLGLVGRSDVIDFCGFPQWRHCGDTVLLSEAENGLKLVIAIFIKFVSIFTSNFRLKSLCHNRHQSLYQ